MADEKIKIGFEETKNVMTKSNGTLGGYAVNPYVGCTHGCK
jgi:DNA repair photolyase